MRDRYHDRTKHIDIKHNFIREAVERGGILLERVPSKENTADILTKSLPKDAHRDHCKNLGLRDINPLDQPQARPVVLG